MTEERSIRDILWDMPDLFQHDIFGREEKEKILGTSFYHRFSFSPILKYYSRIKYGDLILSLEKKIKNRKELNVLEIGCGTGSTSIYLASKEKTHSCTGIDLNSECIAIARKRSEWHEIDNVRFEHQDLFKFEADKRYDVIYSQIAFDHMRPYDLALEKIFEIVANDGDIIFDMANPYKLIYKGKYLNTEDIEFIKGIFKKNKFSVEIDYHGLLSGLDVLNVLNRIPYINQFIRIHARKVGSSR